MDEFILFASFLLIIPLHRWVSKIVEATMLITVILGFTIYFIKQYREHKKFDYLKFIIGKVNCDHNK